MDDNLASQSMDQKSNKPAKPDQKRIDSIPLWLQGISENAAASREPDEGEWLKEQTFVANQETGPTMIEITELDSLEEDEPEIVLLDSTPPEEREAPLPQWIEEAEAPFEDDQTINITPQQKDDEPDEITEEVLIEQAIELDGLVLEESMETEDPNINEEPIAPETSEQPIDLIEQTFEPETVEPFEPVLMENEPSNPVEDLAPWDQIHDNLKPDMVEDIKTNTEKDLAPWDEMSSNFQAIEIEAEIEEPAPDEILPESEEIPDWLREMIAADEKQEKEGAASQVAWQSDEPTQPVVVSPPVPVEDLQLSSPLEDADMDNELEIEDIEEEEEEEEPKPETISRPAVMPRASFSRFIEEPAQEVSPQDDESEPEFPSLDDFDIKLERDFSTDFDESGFQPIQFDPPVLEDQQITDESDKEENDLSQDSVPEENTEFVLEDWRTPSQPEETESDEPLAEQISEYEPSVNTNEQDFVPELGEEIPLSLIQAKQILEQGEVREALAIIKSFINQSQYLDEIKDWLLTANKKFEKNKSGLWEALGDISSHQGEYSKALNAYAKAIEFLELSRKSHNEIG